MVRKQTYKEAKKSLATKAKDVALITFKDIEGTNCSNCIFVKGNFCNHPDLQFNLPDGAEKMCCNLWTQDGMKTSYTEEELKPKEAE